MSLDNFGVVDLFDYYEQTAPIYEKARAARRGR